MTTDLILQAVRLPARVNSAEAGSLLGFTAEEVEFLAKSEFLDPLGRSGQYLHFATRDILKLARSRVWLNKATIAVENHYQ